MEAYSGINPLWDLPQPPTFSQLPEEDFLALLQKQFPSTGQGFQNPSDAFFGGNFNVPRQPLPSMTPPSEDSSPSPPQTHNTSAHSRRQSTQRPLSIISSSDHEEHGDHLKRKASEDDLEDEPNQKNQNVDGKRLSLTSARRKSSAGGPDEQRLLKRKEQNRAAQRAFRERKEKHVKDLEDKVAELEAKNEITQSENENLRDLLSRLQSENLLLKQSSFTFQVPKSSASGAGAAVTSTSPSNSLTSEPTAGSSSKSFADDGIDWNSLTAFDPAMLNLLDDNSQQNNDGMSMDFSSFDGGLSKMPYTTLASNPSFMSFANTFDPVTPTPDTFSFDLQQMAPWQMSPDSGPFLHPQSYDNLLGRPSGSNSGRSNSLPTTAPSPSESASSLFSINSENQHHASDSGEMGECPKTRQEAARIISRQGPSPFAPSTSQELLKRLEGQSGVSCVGSRFPKTQQSDQNVEVLSAWRTITSNPKFKDADINELCSEFSKKARCDGTKVVLEPAGVNHILESLAKHQ